ncbi:MAG: hypothetical protein BHW33_02495 [Firmicutes bacterium CAG:137_57_8]|nr:MAG: hypothetical protein BHW33_02495 [Firmicutes bacterium CAG:137_57_8]
MNGMENNRFQPFTNTTRAQIVTVLWRMAGSPEPESAAPFADLKQGSFYEKAVAWGHEQGIVNGVTETEFYPNSSVTREQMAETSLPGRKLSPSRTMIRLLAIPRNACPGPILWVSSTV